MELMPPNPRQPYRQPERDRKLLLASCPHGGARSLIGWLHDFGAQLNAPTIVQSAGLLRAMNLTGPSASIERMKSRILLLASLTLLLAGPLLAAAADWPEYRGPNHDGTSPERGLLKQWPAGGPRQIWKAPLTDGFSSFTVS